MGVALTSGSYSWGFSTVSEPLLTAVVGAGSLAARFHSAGGHTPTIKAAGLAGGHRSGALFSQSGQPPVLSSPLSGRLMMSQTIPTLSEFSSNLPLS